MKHLMLVLLAPGTAERALLAEKRHSNFNRGTTQALRELARHGSLCY